MATGGHLGYGNGTILAILNLYLAPLPPIKFQLNPTNGLEGDFKDGRYGGHLGYWNRMILAILILHVAQMPPTFAFGLNLT